MCRWIVYASAERPLLLGDVLSRPRHSLVAQAIDACFHPGFTARNNARLNADGFGVAWFTDAGRLVLFKSTSPAWSDANLAELAASVASRVIFGHVRAASPGSVVSHENTHPFKCGRLAFMHNGHVEGFAGVRRALLARLDEGAFRRVRGLTDSEHVFALLQTALRAPERAEPFAPGELAAAVAAAVRAVLGLLAAAPPPAAGGFTSLNLAVTDGETVVATRFCDQWPATPPPSLYFAFPTDEELAADLRGGGGGAAAPGDGAGEPAPPAPAGEEARAGCAGGSADGAAAAAERRAARWARGAAFLARAAPSARARALLVASEPATEGGAVEWFAMPANAMVVARRGGAAELVDLAAALAGGEGGAAAI